MDLDSSTHEIRQARLGGHHRNRGSPRQRVYGGLVWNGRVGQRAGRRYHCKPASPLAMSDLIKKTDGILDNSQEALKDVTQATASLNPISAKIDDGQGTIGALINDRKIYVGLDQTMSGMRDTVAVAQAGVTDFQENMEALKHSLFLRGYFK